MPTSINPQFPHPVRFSGERLDRMLEQFADLIREASRIAEQQAAVDREHAASERLRWGWEKLEAAYALADASEVIAEGRWAGVTRGDATAWCWNLFQFEPHGLTYPGSQVRAEALHKLERGGLPEVFGYPERARAHADRGLTPRTYREHREALGSPTFSPNDVRHR